MLNIYLTLYKNGEIITKVSAKHWWLAIFKLGMFSKPKELTMDINITFKDKEMLNAFLVSFKKLGYKEKDYHIVDNTFCFKYIKPKTHKVWTRNWLIDSIRQFFNRKNVELYNEYLNDLIENNRIDDSKTNNKLIIINELIPALIKNSKEEPLEQEKITKKILGINGENIVLLNSNVYSEIKVKRL